MNLLVGADPELFLRENGVFHSGYGVIPGTKEAPYPVEEGAVQIDGMAVEFNITPADTSAKFINSCHKVMDQLRAMIPQRFELDITPVAEFTPEHMEEQPIEAKRLGCDPDFNAYTGKANPRPEQHPIMRTAAGHVHLGWCEGRDPHDVKHFMSCCELVKMLDLYLGLPSVLLDPDTKRKEMYGKAGAFRPKSYGLEYRVMSNFWLKNDKLMKLVFDNTEAAFKRLVKEGKHPGYYGEAKVQEVINKNEKNNALYMCQTLGIPFKV